MKVIEEFKEKTPLLCRKFIKWCNTRFYLTSEDVKKKSDKMVLGMMTSFLLEYSKDGIFIDGGVINQYRLKEALIDCCIKVDKSNARPNPKARRYGSEHVHGDKKSKILFMHATGYSIGELVTEFNLPARVIREIVVK